MDKSRILVIDDDKVSRKFATRLLDDAGYQWDEAEDGETGLSLASKVKPDLILLDCVMPRMNGIEVLRKLHSHFLTSHVPVIMLTSRDAIDDRIEGLNSGADDYVTKPFNKRDLLARVHATLRRSKQNLAADPSTNLPGNSAIRRELDTRLRQGNPCCIAYIDLDNFKAYADYYGFEKAGHVIRSVPQVLHQVVAEFGNDQYFIGHIGGDDFLMIAEHDTVEQVCERFIARFAERVPEYYDQQDVQQGFILGLDRFGTSREFPLLSVSAAIIDIAEGKSPNPDELASFVGQCKRDIKNNRDNGWRRYSYPTR